MRRVADGVFALDGRRSDVNALVSSLKWRHEHRAYCGVYNGHEFMVCNVAMPARRTDKKPSPRWIGYCSALDERTPALATRLAAVDDIAGHIDRKSAAQADSGYRAVDVQR